MSNIIFVGVSMIFLKISAVFDKTNILVRSFQSHHHAVVNDLEAQSLVDIAAKMRASRAETWATFFEEPIATQCAMLGDVLTQFRERISEAVESLQSLSAAMLNVHR